MGSRYFSGPVRNDELKKESHLQGPLDLDENCQKILGKLPKLKQRFDGANFESSLEIPKLKMRPNPRLEDDSPGE